jgi:CheY-like chemotaxis protein
MASFNYLKILIVEDESAFSEILVKFLHPLKREFPDAEIIIAPTMARAIEIINSVPTPDITVLDLTLADSTPAETIDKIKLIQDKTPVLVLTGLITPEDKEKIAKLGVEVLDKFSMIESRNFMSKIIDTILSWNNDWWIRVQKQREITDFNLQKLKELLITHE